MPKRKETHKSNTSNGHVSKTGGRYNATLKKASEKLLHQAAVCAVVEKEFHWGNEREKLLVDHIRCQEEVERILQLQEQLLAELQAAPDPEAAVQAALARSVADQLPGSNWSTSIAASVTVGHIMAVKGMSMQDWCAAGCKSFMELSALLELCNRDLQPQPQLPPGFKATDTAAGSQSGPTPPPDGPPAATATGAGSDAADTQPGASVTAPAASTAPPPPQQQQQQQQHQQHTSPAAVTAGYQDPNLALRQHTEQSIAGAYAAMFYHPQPYYAAAACNLSTAVVEVMSQEHLMQVVERMALSPRQVMHLRVINTEFVRLARMTSQEGESLAEQAAKMSLSGLTRNSSGSDSSRSPLDNAAQKHARASAAAEKAAKAAAAAEQAAKAAAAGQAAQAAVAVAKAAAAVAAAEGHGSSKPSNASGSAGGSDSGGGAVGDVLDLQQGTSASPGEELQAQLGRYLRHMHIHTVVTAMCIVNTLTPRQMATLSVASFPYAPNVHALAEACMYYCPPGTPAKAAALLAATPTGAAAAAAAASGSGEAASVGQAGPPQQQQEQQQQSGVNEAWARQVEGHMAHRMAQLERQVLEWWRDNDGILDQLTL